jgi:hypothetical protein
MEESKWTGDGVLTDGPLSDQQVLAALRDRSNAFVAIHAPGSTVTMRDGRRYRVAEDGSWRRLPAGDAAGGGA